MGKAQALQVLGFWYQAKRTSAVILEPKKIKSLTVSIVSPSVCREVMGTRCHDLSFLNVDSPFSV